MIIFSRKIFGPPPLLSILYMDIIDNVAAAPGPLHVIAATLSPLAAANGPLT